ncbi:MAG: tRNA (adenosine(37)-N6)-threonylcarbamoyltransferase complex dimerization subunit type 1 TsaB, partial [Chitinophagaceae bacterium]|nr:tRNA (adenosine(37)-N6)-threonylcarbamoyltransferase complex dimerization subunit type 1 TsaB [Chitinophagaceae bacterium]
MSYFLNIDTATEQASVCLSEDDRVLEMLISTDQKNHASFLQPAIQSLLQKTGLSLTQIDAVAVTGGPGSYTGLRVGLASAKGICFTLNKPLIIINTLEVMALAAMEGENKEEKFLICPMIDARRMEVFAAVYDQTLQIIMEPQPMILDPDSFSEILQKQSVLFFGSGAEKLKGILSHPNLRFKTGHHHAGHLAQMVLKPFADQSFADIAYSEPLYLKAFFDTSGKAKS